MPPDASSLDARVHRRLLGEASSGADAGPALGDGTAHAGAGGASAVEGGSVGGRGDGGGAVGRVAVGKSSADEGVVDARTIARLVRHEAPLLDADGIAGVVTRVRARIAGLGVLEPLLADPRVSDLMINGPGPVWVERAGRLERTAVEVDTQAIDHLVERVLAPLGRRADRTTPVVDARLADGSRAHIVLPPLAIDGPAVTIRRFGAADLPLGAFCPAPVADVLRAAVAHRANTVVSGATGAGKTTLLNAMCGHLPPGERVVTIEDAAELRLPGAHVVRLETRPAAPDGVAEVTVRDLVRAALRMRPDRIVVGEVRGPEALDMLGALNTGHDGSLSTCHANGPLDALRRIETLAMLGSAGVPLAAVREHVAGAIDLVVHVERGSGGHRRIADVAEVGLDGDGTLCVRPVVTGGQVVAPLQRARRRSAEP